MSNNSEKKGTTPKEENGGEKMYMIEYLDFDEHIFDTYYPVPQELIDLLQNELQKCIDEGGPFEDEKDEASMRREIIREMDEFYVDIDVYGNGNGIDFNYKLYDIHLDDFYYE